jgi:hypothetical protein
MDLASGYMAVHFWVTVTMNIRLAFPIFPLFWISKISHFVQRCNVSPQYLLIPYFHDKFGFEDALTVLFSIINLKIWRFYRFLAYCSLQHILTFLCKQVRALKSQNSLPNWYSAVIHSFIYSTFYLGKQFSPIYFKQNSQTGFPDRVRPVSFL